jgi:uncharacterized protein YjbJ (UPF0337 family)
MIDVDGFETQWKEIRKNVRQRWPAISDADVNRIDGHVDVLLDLLEEKYGYSRQLAEGEVNRFLQDMNTVQTS